MVKTSYKAGLLSTLILFHSLKYWHKALLLQGAKYQLFLKHYESEVRVQESFLLWTSLFIWPGSGKTLSSALAQLKSPRCSVPTGISWLLRGKTVCWRAMPPSPYPPAPAGTPRQASGSVCCPALQQVQGTVVSVFAPHEPAAGRQKSLETPPVTFPGENREFSQVHLRPKLLQKGDTYTC